MIRRAGPADAPLMAAHMTATGGPWDNEAALTRLLSRPTTLAWVSPAGHALTSVVVDEAELLHIGVIPAHRRRGHGRALLAAATASWCAVGACTAWLEVRTDNTAARALYQACGWEDAGLRRGYYADGCDAVLMRREVEPC